MAYKIAVINQKGGVGKTTTAINVSAQLADSGYQVLLVDLDPQANSTSGLGIDKASTPSTYDVLINRVALNPKATTPTRFNKLAILPSNPELAAAEVELVNQPDREMRLANQLKNCEDFDYIIIDCPPALGLLTINALAAVDFIVIPVQAEYYALEGLSQLLATVQRAKRSLNPKLELLGLVLTLYDKRTVLSSQVRDEVNKHFPDKIFKTIVPRNVKLAEAPSFGKTIYEHDNWSKGARAYKKLTKEIIEATK